MDVYLFVEITGILIIEITGILVENNQGLRG